MAQEADEHSLGRAYVENLFEQFESIHDMVEAVQKESQKLIAGFDVRFLQEAVRRDREAKQVRTLNDYLEPVGWFVPPILDEVQRSNLLEMVDSAHPPEVIIDQLILIAQETAARTIVEAAAASWAFSGRAALLEDALAAHEEGKYSLSIPVFLAQAEGAFIGLLVSAGASSEHRPGLFRRAVPDEIVDLVWQLPITEIILHTHMLSFSAALATQFTESVWTAGGLAALRGRYPSGCLSRHGIMHGIDTDYATRENGVKSLFALDVVRELLDYLEPSNGAGA